MAEVDNGCQGKAWAGGAVAGLIVTAFLLLVGNLSFLAALFMGLITFGLLGSFLVWSFCSGSAIAAPPAYKPVSAPKPAQRVAETPVAPKPAAPAAPTAAAPVAPSPAPAPKPAPAAAPVAAAPTARTVAAAAEPVAAAAPEVNAVPDASDAPVKAKPAKAKPAAKKTTKAAAKPAKAEAKPAKASKAAAAKPAKAATVPEGGSKPRGLKAPRKSGADDLKQIEGIGPVLEKLCNDLGIWHFDQIAKWGAAEVAWMDSNLKGFRGRVTRDKWVSQAKIIGDEGLERFLERAKTNDY